MKQAIPIALLAALVLAVPAIPQGDNADLAARVEKLEKKLAKQQVLLKIPFKFIGISTPVRIMDRPGLKVQVCPQRVCELRGEADLHGTQVGCFMGEGGLYTFPV